MKAALGVGVVFGAIGFMAGGAAGGALLGLMFGAVTFAFAKDFR